MGRLTIDITDQQHQSIKALAALQGKSIKEYTIEKLFVTTSDEETALKELKFMLNQRIEDSKNGKVLEHSLSEIAEGIIASGYKK